MFDFLRPMFRGSELVADPQQYVKDTDQLLAEARDLRDTAIRLRKDDEKEWMLAWAYYKGRHWVTWREDRWVESEATDRPKLTVNFIQHLVQIRLGHLIKNRPMMVGVPGNDDEQSREGARTALKVMEAYHYKLKLARKYAEVVRHMLVTGQAYLKNGWDPHGGTSYERPGPGGRTLSGMLGDLVCDVVRVNEFLPEPGALDLDSCQRGVYRTFPPMATLRRLYGSEALKGLEPIDPTAREGAAMIRQLYAFDGAVPAAMNDRIELMEVFYRKGVSRTGSEGGEYEGGLRAIIAGDRVLQVMPTPEGWPAIPLVAFQEIQTDGFYATSVARGLIDTNKVVDVQLSHQEHNRKVHRPKVLIPAQAQLAEGAWNKEDDEQIEYYYPYKPEAYTPPALPPNQVEIRNSLIGLMKELGGNFDVLSGTAQSDVRSGRMVAYMQEYAGTVLGVPAANIEAAVEDVGNQHLRLLQTYVREDRMEAYVGRDRRMEIVHFKQADLQSMAAIRVQEGSAIPTSRAEKTDRITGWMKDRLMEPAKGFKLLNMVDPDTDLYSDDEQDRQVADEVAFKLSRVGPDELKVAMERAGMIAAKRNMGRQAIGQPPVPQSERDILRALKIEAFEFENHEAIVAQMDKVYRKTQAYRNSTPELRTLVDAFCDWHVLLGQGMDLDNPELMAARRQMEAAQPPAATSGAEPGEGGAPKRPGPAPGPVEHGPEGGPEAKVGLPPVRAAPTPLHG